MPKQQVPEKFEILIISNRKIFQLPWMVKKFIKGVTKLFHFLDEYRRPSINCPLTSDLDVELFHQLFSGEGDEQKHSQQRKQNLHSVDIPISHRKGNPGKWHLNVWGLFDRVCPASFVCYFIVKKVAIFLPPADMSITKLSLAGNNLIIHGQGEFG
jgi:hypothetical protein